MLIIELVSLVSHGDRVARVVRSKFGYRVIGKLLEYNRSVGFTITSQFVVAPSILNKESAIKSAEKWVKQL